jgi:hypothetical protein
VHPFHTRHKRASIPGEAYEQLAIDVITLWAREAAGFTAPGPNPLTWHPYCLIEEQGCQYSARLVLNQPSMPAPAVWLYLASLTSLRHGETVKQGGQTNGI